MRSQAQGVIELVQNLADVIDMRKQIEKEEKDIKAKIKEIMANELLLEAGNYAVSIKERSRRDIDKALIMQEYGAHFFKKYEKLITYEIMEINLIRRAEAKESQAISESEIA